jgi:hypothetical protein
MDTRREILFVGRMPSLGLKTALVLAGLRSLTAATTAPPADLFVYFGTHRAGPHLGFSLAHFDTDTGVLTPPRFPPSLPPLKKWVHESRFLCEVENQFGAMPRGFALSGTGPSGSRRWNPLKHTKTR